MENNMKLNKLLLIRSVFTACIEDQDIIDRILAHLRDKELATPSLPLLTPPSRAPPETR